MRKHRACRSDSLSVVAQLRTGVSSTQPQVCFLRRGLRVSVQRDAGERPRTPGPESGAWAFPSVSGLLGLLTVRRSLGGVVAKGASARSGSNAPGSSRAENDLFLFSVFCKRETLERSSTPFVLGAVIHADCFARVLLLSPVPPESSGVYGQLRRMRLSAGGPRAGPSSLPSGEKGTHHPPPRHREQRGPPSP